MIDRLSIFGLLITCLFASLSCQKVRLELNGQEGIILVLLDEYTSDNILKCDGKLLE